MRLLYRPLPVLSNDVAGGLVLILSAILALALANSPASADYFLALETKLGGLNILHWVNDGLMAVFFFFVGLEIKRELMMGELDTWRKRALPGLAALGGMVVPILVFASLNMHNPAMLRGAPIPAATDIAFALGILAFLGARVPASLKIFLTALAILDDMGAIAIIAVFYTSHIDAQALGLAACTVALLALANRLHVTQIWIYAVLAAMLWFFTLHSGIHATLAGVVAACFVPLGNREDHHSPLHRLEHGLKPWINLAVLPLFGLANAGVALGGFDMGNLQSPLVLGIVLGLFLGKQVGVFGACWVAERLGLARRPTGTTWLQLYGVALLCGIGFTMSLFIGLLAFSDPILQEAVKLAVLAGSAISALAGIAVLFWAVRK